MLGKAIVIGGSIAGLLAARVLSDYFKEIILIEKDNYVEGNKVRNGVPQANHVHILLVKGRKYFKILFQFWKRILSKKGQTRLTF